MGDQGTAEPPGRLHRGVHVGIWFRFRRRGCSCRAVVVVDGGDSGWVDGDWLDVVQVDVDWVDGGWVDGGWVVCPRVA